MFENDVTMKSHVMGNEILASSMGINGEVVLQLQIDIDLILFTEQEFLDIIRPDLDNINFETFVLRNLKISHNLETSKQQTDAENFNYCKVSKFSDARKLWCNLPKILERRPNLRVFCQKRCK